MNQQNDKPNSQDNGQQNEQIDVLAALADDIQAEAVEIVDEEPDAEADNDATFADAQRALQELDDLIEAQGQTVTAAENDVQSANKNYEDAKAHKKVLEDLRKELEQLVRQFKTAANGLERPAQTAQNVTERATQTLAELLGDLQVELSDTYRQHIDDAIASTDARIEDLEQDVDTASTQVVAAQEKVDETKSRIAAADAAYRNAQAELKQLGTAVQSATREVEQLETAAIEADKNGQSGEAYFLTHELAAAIHRLEEIINDDTLEQLFTDIWESWLERANARKQLLQDTDALKAAQSEIADAQDELKTAEQQRIASIQQQIQEFPEDEKPAEPDATVAESV